MGKLILSRKKEWQNKAKSFKVYLDGEKRATISNGEIKEIEMEPGKHQLQLKVDWCSSPEIELDISDDKSITMKTSGYKFGSWITAIMSLLFGAFFLIKIFFNQEIKVLIIIMLPFFLIMLYYLTFGRKRYIVLEYC